MTRKEHIPTETKSGLVPVAERLKALDETQYFAVLATNDNNKPYTSLISFAVTPDLKEVVFATPKETRKFQNLLAIKNVSLLIDTRSNRRKKLMETEAITIMGKARQVLRGRNRKWLLEIFLRKHPDLEDFVRSDSTALIAVKVARCIHVGKFQTVSVWRAIGPVEQS
jgi:nitroimidazol reductase NimA-like FMN-containing flavoprotein (pyridoxamine 5'-phosphate oxidase superfamily)